MPDLLSASNGHVKRLRKLVTQRKARSRERAFVVDGPTLAVEALDGAAAGTTTVESLFLDPSSPSSATLVERAETLDVPVRPVATEVLSTILDPVAPQPVAAIVGRTSPTVADLAAGSLVLCLVEARDPGNVGTLIRSAEASGAAGIVLAGSSVDPTNPKAVRASAGSILRLPVVELATIDDALDQLRAAGRTIVAATVAAGQAIPYDEVRLVDATVLLGNEAHGLPGAVVSRADAVATIPLAGRTESLNVAVAGSLFCFEALRQSRSGAAQPPEFTGHPDPPTAG